MTRTWLRTPVQWQSTRVANPMFVHGLTDEEVAFIRSKWRNYLSADWDYSQPTVEFFCAGIAWLLILNVIFRLRSRTSTTGSSSAPSWLDRLTAICRYTVASQYRVKIFGWYSPPLAAIIGVAGMFTFIMALMLAARPYFWKPNMGSMPIANRTGWISIGIVPFVIAFSTKVNWVGMLTGTSHEKLQVFHRWSASIMYITSLVHTFVFIVMSIRQGQMEENWRIGTFYWTGVAALVPQTWLMFMSWGIIRNKYYETFKKIHFVAALLFIFFLFIHCNWVLTSWHYFWATFAIYFLAFFTRILRIFYNSLFGLAGSVESLPDGMIKLAIQTPSRVRWAPGQHVFVRFLSLGIHNFSSHPFTIVSIPGEAGRMELIFAVKGGITKKLADLARDKDCQTLAGGSGVTFTLSILLDFLQRVKVSELKCKHIEFVLAVKSNDSILWLEDQLTAAKETGITVKVHVTQSNVPSISNLKEHGDLENDSCNGDIDVKQSLDVACGRPNLPAIIHKACRTNSGTMAIADSFLYDVRNAVADCQPAIADGYGQCRDLFFHTENYGFVTSFTVTNRLD
ncbi:hypothetical protein VKT23_013257 [Stygiomarasmius scandens]|uniref:ferric-chelate reductase (NADPH) n=1 Tax=Marasmiellus scandens TaxID=2682957 RepID=A0ABR1J448_9AGAR